MNEQVNYAKIQRIQDNLDALVIGQFGTGFVTDAMLYESGIKATVTQHTSQLADIVNLKSDIRGTTQNVTTNSNGDITQVEHVNESSTVLRRDTFNYSTPNLIIETRTWISTNDTLIYKYHTDTMSTEVI